MNYTKADIKPAIEGTKDVERKGTFESTNNAKTHFEFDRHDLVKLSIDHQYFNRHGIKALRKFLRVLEEKLA